MGTNGNGEITITKGKVVIGGSLFIAIVTTLTALVPNIHASNTSALEKRVVECEKNVALIQQSLDYIGEDVTAIRQDVKAIRQDLKELNAD